MSKKVPAKKGRQEALGGGATRRPKETSGGAGPRPPRGFGVTSKKRRKPPKGGKPQWLRTPLPAGLYRVGRPITGNGSAVCTGP